jgi:hypothetical protein
LYDAINIVSTDTVENVFAAVNHIFYVNFVFIQATNFSLITVISLKFLDFNGCCNQEVALLIYEIHRQHSKLIERKLLCIFPVFLETHPPQAVRGRCGFIQIKAI